jgi:hypothetical protein
MTGLLRFLRLRKSEVWGGCLCGVRRQATKNDGLPHGYFFSAVKVPLPTSPYTTVPLILVPASRVPL